VWVENEVLVDLDKKTFESNGNLLTPAEVAEKLRVTPEQIRSLIRQGQISAVNVGTGPKRPLYRITGQAFDDFLNRRRQPCSVAKRRRKFKQLPTSQDFFPHLK
jgi:excisionase family DNA binding protein